MSLPTRGVWIEIMFIVSLFYKKEVTPYMGVWIEIQKKKSNVMTIDIAPYTGAWIEITRPSVGLLHDFCYLHFSFSSRKGYLE